MKIASMLLALLLACLVGVNAASGEEKKGKKKQGGKSAAEQFKKMDANSDGKVTKEEFAAHSKDKEKAGKRFEKLAKGKDSISLEDYEAAVKAMKEKQAKKKGEGQK